MHQQPPKIPLLSSTNAANAGHVDSSRALTLYSGTTAERNPIRTRPQPARGDEQGVVLARASVDGLSYLGA
jgi:hypothetical protein